MRKTNLYLGRVCSFVGICWLSLSASSLVVAEPAAPIAVPADNVAAPAAPVQIGGPYGVNLGGGNGLRIGGPYGVQIGGGRGARFGGPYGARFGGGQGAQFGGPYGVHIDIGRRGGIAPPEVGEQPSARQLDLAPADDTQFSKSIALHLPREASGPVKFVLNDATFTIEPGQTIRFESALRPVIAFHSAEGLAPTKYSLPAGDYVFRQTATGWELYATPVKPSHVEELPPPGPAR